MDLLLIANSFRGFRQLTFFRAIIRLPGGSQHHLLPNYHSLRVSYSMIGMEIVIVIAVVVSVAVVIAPKYFDRYCLLGIPGTWKAPVRVTSVTRPSIP